LTQSGTFSREKRQLAKSWVNQLPPQVVRELGAAGAYQSPNSAVSDNHRTSDVGFIGRGEAGLMSERRCAMQ
jgi:hypothetical protein